MKGFRLFFVSVTLLSSGVFAQNPSAQVPAVQVEKPEICAEVNGDKITKSDLAAECLRLHGESELENQVKKFLIQLECARLKITVSKQEIDAEVLRMAKTFNFSTEEWLELLQKERGMAPEQYMADVIWPLLAIGKLAGTRLTISEADIDREFEARFGPAVQVRQIVLGSQNDAQRIHAEVTANPESFPSVAKNNSLDPASKPYGGLIHPVRRHVLPDSNIENVIFSLQPGQISPIVQTRLGEFIVFKCEQRLQPQNVDKTAVREQLVMKIRDKTMRSVSEQVFQELQDKAKIELVLGNAARMAQLPGVAALVNDRQITTNYLAEVCMERFGLAVLEDMISRTIIRQACERQKIVLSEADIDAEIREMAIKNLPLKVDGSPNVEMWIKLATENGQVKPAVYRTNTVWPVLALKRLTRGMVQVTEEDIQRSFEANFGKKVRCLAIAFELKDQRRALEVWEMANNRRTPEHFGDLAEKYSADSDSRMARGVIPLISRYSGQPVLEEEAFKLLPNEISQILQVDESLVILYCLGHEEAAAADLNDMRADLVADIFEKKQKLAVELYYRNIYSQAAFDNYLSGQTQNPAVEKALQEQAESPQQASSAMQTVQ